MNICRVCKEEKPLEDFDKHPGFKSGRSTRCKECRKIYDRERNKKLKEKQPLIAHSNIEEKMIAEKILTNLGYELYDNKNPVHKQFEKKFWEWKYNKKNRY